MKTKKILIVALGGIFAITALAVHAIIKLGGVSYFVSSNSNYSD